MEYPKINNKNLDSINRKRFDKMMREVNKSIEFDNSNKDFNLSKGDIHILSWNIATNLIMNA